MALEIGICSYFKPDLDPAEIVRLLSETDFKTVSVWGADRDNISPSPKWYKNQLCSAREDFGFVLESLHAPFVLTSDLSSSDNSVRSKAVDRLKLALDDAVEIEIPIVIIHAHRRGDPAQLSAQGCRSFAELVEAAVRSDVRLAVENTLDSNGPLEWILSEFPAEHVGLCYDSGHDQLGPGQTFDLLGRWGHRLLTTHIHDNRGEADDHLPPGEGTIDWQGFAQAFPWESYQGNFMLEATMAVTSFGEPAEFLRQCYAGAQRILALAGQGN